MVFFHFMEKYLMLFSTLKHKSMGRIIKMQGIEVIFYYRPPICRFF